jgi:hypothetical protein
MPSDNLQETLKQTTSGNCPQLHIDPNGVLCRPSLITSYKTERSLSNIRRLKPTCVQPGIRKERMCSVWLNQTHYAMDINDKEVVGSL